MAIPPSSAVAAGQRFGLNRNVAVLMAVILVVGVGEELWVRFLPAYLEALGGGVWVVAAYGALFYLFTPFDLVPDVMPVFGYVDDFGMLGFAVAYYGAKFPHLPKV